MPKLVVNGAKLKCSQGAAPGTLTVLPANGTDADETPAATVEDYVPMTNVGAFGMCQSQANPAVAAATAAAAGVLTPQPCVPVTTSAWSPGSSVVTIQGMKALTDDSTCNCTWNGTIEITEPGTSVDVD
ncbi:MAG: DUF4280 domain-containing protein [Polyangiaceae bacterium]|nr:DUF4280 domain-containing protein [Polyangiaceae bacterium]